ncbi:restriction endonuclease [Methanofollis ethanolicus]|uniref:restriction endonuclease n=1 Tax=Methanofollis ethanolicus TaxID=488124 RepID=UPI0009FAD25D|nr:restriction endonuclease [Methanofollis ethanolicus]
MSEFLIQPEVYSTGRHQSLIGLLEDIWIKNNDLGKGTYYVLSGYGNYNGGVRFFSTFQRHIDEGGRVVSIFGASTSQRQTSKQLVERLLECGCIVYLVNRKNIFHSKCYGYASENEDKLIVTSGNFTSRGISNNVEAAVYLDTNFTHQIKFQWNNLETAVLTQNWDIYTPTLTDPENPAWQLLYDEHESGIGIEESQTVTMVMTLGHADTVRINADPGTKEARGSQYFWLSKNCYDFFPPLTILNSRGYKTTNQCLINLYYVDLKYVDKKTRVTFEAGNNVDFRLGTARYRNTKLAQENDLMVLSRISENNYEIRIIRKNSPKYNVLRQHAVDFIGHRGKRIGYIQNKRLEEILEIQLLKKNEFERLLSNQEH